MSLIEQAKNRREEIYRYLVSKKHEHNLVHINALGLSKKFHINRNAILADIKYLLEHNFIKGFMVEAHVYQLVLQNDKKINNILINNLNTYNNIIDNLNFTSNEEKALLEFEQHRKDIGKPLSNMAYEKMMARAAFLKTKGIDLVKHIDYSIAAGKDYIYENLFDKQTNNTILTFKEKDEQNRINKIDQTRKNQEAMHHFLTNDENNLIGYTNT